MSAIFPPNSNRGKGLRSLALLLLAAAALLAGCFGATPVVLTRADNDLLEAKGGDEALADAVRKGEKDPFAMIAVFRKDVFLGQSAMLDRSSIPVLGEFGNAALLLVRANEVLPLLKDPAVVKAAWFGPQGRLARMTPELEMEMLKRFGRGTEDTAVTILTRFRNVPKAEDERAVDKAGFTILSREGPAFVVTGPLSAIPRLLGHDWVIYLDKAAAP